MFQRSYFQFAACKKMLKTQLFGGKLNILQMYLEFTCKLFWVWHYFQPIPNLLGHLVFFLQDTLASLALFHKHFFKSWCMFLGNSLLQKDMLVPPLLRTQEESNRKLWLVQVSKSYGVGKWNYMTGLHISKYEKCIKGKVSYHTSSKIRVWRILYDFKF